MHIPIFPKAHDLTIAQSLYNQDLFQSAMDQIFNQIYLDYLQESEALFLSNSTKDKLQILS
jgi:hypothetical protein